MYEKTESGIFQKVRIKNLRRVGSVRSDFKKLDSFTLDASKNQLIRSFLRIIMYICKPAVLAVWKVFVGNFIWFWRQAERTKNFKIKFQGNWPIFQF